MAREQWDADRESDVLSTAAGSALCIACTTAFLGEVKGN